MQRMFDQVSDRGLVKLSDMFQPFIGGIKRAEAEFIEDAVLPALAGHMGENFHIMFNQPPQMQMAVVETPSGPAVIKIMRQAHGDYMKQFTPRFQDDVPEERMEDEIRHRMFTNGAAFALDDEKLFPVGNPSEAILSLLYALGQREHLGSRYADVVRPNVVDAVGNTVVQDVETFVKALQNGMKEFVDPITNKKIVVTIEDFCEDADALQRNMPTEPKVASLGNLALARNPFRKKQYQALLKKSGMTQTSLLKLSLYLQPYKKFSGVENLINLLKISMRVDGTLTVKEADVQQQLLAKLSEIFKGIPGISDDWLKSLVYNTDLPSSEPAIVHIEGFPIDTKKVQDMTYEQASLALTPAVADIIFDDAKKNIDLSKMTEFISKLINKPADEAEREEIRDRIVDPILREFAPEDETADDVGVSKG